MIVKEAFMDLAKKNYSHSANSTEPEWESKQ